MIYRSLGWCCFNGCSTLGIVTSLKFETRELIGHVLFFQIEPSMWHHCCLESYASLKSNICRRHSERYLSNGSVLQTYLHFISPLNEFYWMSFERHCSRLHVSSGLDDVICVAFSSSCCQLQVEIEFARKLFVWEGYQRNLCRCPLSIKLELRLKFSSRTVDLYLLK